MSVLFAPLRFIWRKRRFLTVSSVLIGLLLLASLSMVRAYSAVYAQSRIYTLDAAPDTYRVAIVFGAWVRPNGRLSAMLADRVKMGTELYHAGKVEALLLTGDNSIDTYNEPEAMRQYALEAGVPDEAIILDYAGFRTYDSCYRAQAIFEVDAAILVTQAFHLDRALLTCNGLGLDSIGVAADAMRPTGYARSSMFISQLREMPSTAVAVFDLLSGSQPTFLGDPLPIFAEE